VKYLFAADAAERGASSLFALAVEGEAGLGLSTTLAGYSGASQFEIDATQNREVSAFVFDIPMSGA